MGIERGERNCTTASASNRKWCLNGSGKGWRRGWEMSRVSSVVLGWSRGPAGDPQCVAAERESDVGSVR